MDRRLFLTTALTCFVAPQVLACAKLEPVNLTGTAAHWQKLVDAARQQIGETTIYDPAYVRLSYPGGDVPRERGVCTDVVIRAYRDAYGVDLQKLVHEDMRENFADYPKRWSLKKPDRNIDHRRVPNLQTFFRRKGADLGIPDTPEGFQMGDLVTMMLPGNLPHIGIVSDQRSPADNRPLLIHNIGGGAREDDILTAFKIDERFRFIG
jgi:uncharacterized protein